MINDVLRIERESFPNYPYDERVFLTLYLYQPDLFLVVMCDDKIVGYICGFISSKKCGHIASIAVDKNMRGRGLGSMLLSEFEKIVKSLGYKCVELEVSEDNADAIRMYTSNGYVSVYEKPRYYPDGKTAIVMEKELID